MGQTRKQATEAAAGVFDAQEAIDRLESDMAVIRDELSSLKQSVTGIDEIRTNMVTLSALDSMMQRYMTISSASTVTNSLDTEGTSQVRSHVSTQPVSLQTTVPITSAPVTQPAVSTGNSKGQYQSVSVPLNSSAVMTDSITCTTTKQHPQYTAAYVQQSNGMYTPQRFQVPVISQPLQTHSDQPQVPPNPGIWSSTTTNPYQVQIPPNFNPVTGQFLSIDVSGQQHGSGFRIQTSDFDRNDRILQVGGSSYYADAVLKGPRLEISLFAGDDPIGWLQQCENFFDMSGTPYEQWVNIATGHFQCVLTSELTIYGIASLCD